MSSDSRNAFRAGWSLLSTGEKRRAIWLAVAIVAVGCVDAVALLSVLPVVKLVTEPAVLEHGGKLTELHRMLGSPSVERLFPILAIISLLLLLLSSVLRVASEYVTYRLAASCQVRLSRELLEGALEAPYAWALSQSPTSLTRLVQSDVSLWANSFVRRVGILANACVSAVVAVGMVFVLSPVPILIVMAAVVVIAWIILHATRPAVMRLSKVHRAAADAIAVTAHQALSGLKDVKMTGATPAILELFSSLVRRFGRAVAMSTNLRQLPTTAVMFLGQAALIVVTVILWKAGAKGGEIASQVALLVLASSRLLPAMNRLSTGAGVLWDVLPYLAGIQQLKGEIEQARALEAGDSRPKASSEWRHVTFDAVTFSYPHAVVPAVREFDFAFERGGIYGITGPSGAGKSTVVDLLAGLLCPQQGNVMVGEQRLSALSPRSWRAQIGYVPQTPFVLDDTLRANIAFGVPTEKIDDGLVKECLRLAHMEDVADALANGLDTRLGDRGMRLSGGQRQRIAIARALYKQPRLLILDEATSALDAISELAIQEAVAGLRGNVTVVIIAHRLSTIRNVDTILLMEAGRLSVRGSYDRLIGESELFRSLAAERLSVGGDFDGEGRIASY